MARIGRFMVAVWWMLVLGACSTEVGLDVDETSPSLDVSEDVSEIGSDLWEHPDLVQQELTSMPFRANGDGFERWVDDIWKPISVRGMNLGVGIPGTNPGELAPSYDEYRLWFSMMTDAGFNVLRI